ncbi:MAG: c-type cytochrome [Geminicoccales bacterium]
MKLLRLVSLTLASLISLGEAKSQPAADAKRGGEAYRLCAACHSLQPDTHATGPSLANLWGKKAGMVSTYARYSEALKNSGIVWDEDTMNAWISDPQALVPGTHMALRGIEEDRVRSDVLEFLKVAMAEGGAVKVIDQGLTRPGYVRGPIPEPLKSAPKDRQVTEVRHCRDDFFVSTADGRTTPYWEMNVRLKIDSRATGPLAGSPVIAGAGMMGDRVSIVFSNLAELTNFVNEKCK